MVYVFLLCKRGHSGDVCLSVSILFGYERRMGHLLVLTLARVQRVALGSVVLVGCTWWSVCNFV